MWPIASTGEAAACPQLAEGDIRALDTEAVFDPQETFALMFGCNRQRHNRWPILLGLRLVEP